MKHSDDAIKGALLILLAAKPVGDITMTEIAREAGISRSTLYCHYRNINEIFRACVIDFSKNLMSLDSQLRCRNDSEAQTEKIPFCIALRDSKKYSALVRDASFLQEFLDVIEKEQTLSSDADIASSSTKNNSAVQQSLLRFQLSGCYSAALSVRDDDEWEHIQCKIDDFIASGRRAV